MTTLLLVAVVFSGSLLLSALVLWLGARWVKAAKASFLRALVAAFVTGALGIPVLLAARHFEGASAREDNRTDLAAQSALLIGFVLIGYVLLTWLIFKLSFKTTSLGAIAVWALNFVGGLAALAIIFGAIKPFVLEAFIVPTNAMAPAVLGWHESSVCPWCQGLLILPTQPPDERNNVGFEQEQVGICSSCLKTSSVKASGSSLQMPDRIMVNKLLTPRRWDIIVFRFPLDPTVKYIMRLVGVPGETVYIKNGEVWVNEVPSLPPPELAGLRYVTGAEKIGLGDHGTPENPWRLGQDEYCVLGDFSERSADSRSWGPVPGANIEGVVGLCYWPPSRWKMFR